MEEAGVGYRERNQLETEPIGRLIVKYSTPSMVALASIAIYDIVDQIFIARGVGYLGNGATAVIFLFIALAMSVTMMIGEGTASYISLTLGEGKQHMASRGACAGILGIVTAGVLFGIVFIVFLEPLCKLFGAENRILPYAVDYGFIIALSMPFICINAGFTMLIRADGRPGYAMAGQLLGCLVNLIGDPICIFVLGMGIKGAAFATLLGQLANSVLCIAYLWRFQSVSINTENGKGSWKMLWTVSRLGISSFFSQIAMTIVMAAQNNILVKYGASSKYGPEIPIAAFGVITQIYCVVTQLINGLAGGAQPIFGYNFGAGNIDRVKQTFKRIVVCSTIILSITWLWFQFAPMSIVAIMGQKSGLYQEFSIKCLKVYLKFIFLNGIQMTSVVFFQSIGCPFKTTVLSLARQILFFLPVMFCLTWQFGIYGMLWSGPVADLLAFFLAVLMLSGMWKKIENNRVLGRLVG